MANRKVLINRHTSTSGAPIASEMYKGEIAVAHQTGKEILWTKNEDDVMVPFISCGQTISIIDGKIAEVNVVYDVNKKNGEPYINVETGETGNKKTFTLSTSGVASETNLNALSSATVSNLQNMTNILSALTDVVITGITGDSIISATLSDPSTGTSNGYTLTHKTGEETSGFNKLTTDAYGHVTAATPVAASDIEALGFKTSAETGEEIDAVSGAVDTFSAATVAEFNSAFTAINNLSADTEAAIDQVYASGVSYTDSAITVAIEALDSSISASTTGKYLTAISIKDGMLDKIEEADIPVLEVESAGTGNVVSKIEVNDHKITYTTTSVATSTDIQNLSAATINLSAATTAISEDLETLSGAVEDFSGFTDAKFTALSAGTIQLSADTKAAIAALSAGTIQLSADTKAAIDELAGKAVTSVTFNGVEKAANNVATLVETQLTTAVTGDGNVFSEIAVSDHTITMTKGITALQEVTATGDSYVNASVAGKSAITVSLANVADSSADITAATTTGALADAKAVKDYVESIVSSAVNYKGATSSVPSDPAPIKGDLWIADSAFTVGTKNVEVGDFIIYNGSSWDVIEKNLDGAITGNLTQNTVTLGDSTNSVKSLANGSNGQVLTMVEGAPAWANDPELSVVSAGTGNVVSDITVSDHEITFTKGVTAADDADLKALSGVVGDFSAATDAKFTTLSAYTKDVDDKVKALSAGTIQLSADTKAAIEQLSGFAHNSMIARDDAVFSSAKTYADEKVAAEIALLDSSAVTSSNKHYITGIAIADGKISGFTEAEVPAGVTITATTGAAVDTPSAVLTGVTANGTDNHNLTFGMSNKVFSASTANEALSAKTAESAQTAVSASMAYELSSAATITSGQVTNFVEGVKSIETNSATTAESAQTSVSATVATDAVHASAATKVDQKLTFADDANDVEYDGSAAQTITFGTATSSTGVNGRSMSITNGVVDVEIIDCGEY